MELFKKEEYILAHPNAVQDVAKLQDAVIRAKRGELTFDAWTTAERYLLQQNKK